MWWLEDAGDDEAIPLFNVKADILEKVIEYCKHHKDSRPDEIAKPLKSANLQEVIFMRCVLSQWFLVDYIRLETITSGCLGVG